MLVLARKTDQSILIGDDIEIKVVSIDKGVVKLGIEAPKELSIIRNELLEDIKELNKEATKQASNQQLKELSSKIIKK